jgi:uncharacterized DUF497 family protein
MGEGHDATEFDWDGGNADKNRVRHRVSQAECEQVFFNQPLAVGEDEIHSLAEHRQFALGSTDAGRRLFVIYTLRGERVRIISARDMTAREKKEYEHVRAKEQETDSEV